MNKGQQNLEQLMLSYITLVVATYQLPFIIWHNYFEAYKKQKK